MDTELDRLVQAGVLKKIDYSHWAPPIVIVHKKNGTVRICADFKTGLNDPLETHRHPLPTPEGLTDQHHAYLHQVRRHRQRTALDDS